MPGFTSYSVDNDKTFRNAVDRALKITDDLRIPFTLIAADFYRSQTAIWKLKGPGQYPDLSPNYKPRKLKKTGFIYPILKLNGFLETAASIQGGPGNITKIGAKDLEMGVDEKAIPYAIFHQLGTKKMPMRKFLFIGPEAIQFASSEQIGRLERWMGILNEFMAQKLKQSGMGEVKS
jgi:phage gpG-like protein